MQVIGGGFFFFEEISPESPRKMHNQEVTSETSSNATRRKDEDGCRKLKFCGTVWKASPDTLMEKVAMNGGK